MVKRWHQMLLGCDKEEEALKNENEMAVCFQTHQKGTEC